MLSGPARAGDGLRRGQGGERGHRPAISSPPPAWRSARPPTWRRSRPRPIPTSTTGRTSTPSACWPTRCSPGGRRSPDDPAAGAGRARDPGPDPVERHRRRAPAGSRSGVHAVPRQASRRPLADGRRTARSAGAAGDAQRRDDADRDSALRVGGSPAPTGGGRSCGAAGRCWSCSLPAGHGSLGGPRTWAEGNPAS